jgi:D-beta-D-heptose 7-phosphate kinase / D-beta-D-heptose 1-phosphate adenosyltransferase
LTEPVLAPLPPDEVCTAIAPRRAKGEKVVFTNGVFDLVHPGHIRYLRQARSMGDLLIIAINSDASVRRIKGDKRPLLPEHERARILASFEMVDYVTVFDEDTPLEIINRIQPDVLVKGGDYSLDEIVGRKEVEARGGRVISVPLVEGASSSNIIDRIVSAHSNS